MFHPGSSGRHTHLWRRVGSGSPLCQARVDPKDGFIFALFQAYFG